MMRTARSHLARLLSLVACLTAVSGCYRLESPPKLGETIRVEFVGNDARLVRSQGYVTDAVAKALVQRLGWQISPTGTAKLQLALREERINDNSQDSRGITNSWSIRIEGTALLVARGGSIMGTFTGLGNSTGLSTSQGESEALQAAATQSADDLVSWLDTNARPLVR